MATKPKTTEPEDLPPPPESPDPSTLEPEGSPDGPPFERSPMEDPSHALHHLRNA